MPEQKMFKNHIEYCSLGRQMRNFRLDERNLLEYRPIDIRKGVIEMPREYVADGSSFVTIGKTKVVATAKFEIAQPFSDRPNEAVITVNADPAPFASRLYIKSNPYEENMIELARIIDRGIRESRCIPIHDLCLVEGQFVWVIFVDLFLLDDDGNAIDASGLAAIAALLDAHTYPTGIVDNQTIIYEDRRIPLNKIPVFCTVGWYANRIIVDPTKNEEKNAEGLVCFSLSSSTDINTVQLLKGHLSENKITAAMHIAMEKYDFLRGVLESGKESDSLVGAL